MLVTTWFGFLLGAFALAFNFSAQIALGAPLEARIEHTAHMSSVNETMRRGARFNLTVNETPGNVWIKIPSWLAGTWLVDTETAVYRKDFRTGKVSDQRTPFRARSKFHYGHQRDRTKEIWHYVGIPYTSSTDAATFTEYHQVASKESMKSTANEIALKTQVTVVRVDKITRKITKTFQQESITTYTYVSPQELELRSSTKVFDASGAATNLQQNEAMVKRVETFTPINVQNGKNYKQLFREFLIAEGLERLIPDGTN